MALAEAKVAVVGGDRRQLAVAEALAAEAAEVVTFGLPESAKPGVSSGKTLNEALSGARVVVLPIGGIGSGGRVSALPGQTAVFLSDEFLSALAPGTLILAGSVPPELRNRIVEAGHRLIEYAEIDEIAIANSIPTAEGALQLAMEEMPITIHGCCCFVLGLGRVGLTTTRLFKAVGADTWVVANRPALRARAHEMGCPALTFAEMAKELGRPDLIINTVPAMVLPAPLVALTKPTAYLIDLASAPGGIDHEAAGAMGRKSVLALGLPGKVAPESAGRILAAALPAIIHKELD